MSTAALILIAWAIASLPSALIAGQAIHFGDAS